MASMSTSLDDLGSAGGGGPPADEERVRRILAEMNAGDVVQAPPPPAPMMAPRIITEPPISMSTGQLRMDVGTARANIIGNSSPTPADFHSMFQAASPGMAPFHGPAVIPGASIPTHSKHSSWKDSVAAQLRGPVAVAIIVFLLNMPVVTSILSRYASWMYLSSGEISVGGLLVKAILASFLFALYQVVSAILDK
jgi:hypothetical protein